MPNANRKIQDAIGNAVKAYQQQSEAAKQAAQQIAEERKNAHPEHPAQAK